MKKNNLKKTIAWLVATMMTFMFFFIGGCHSEILQEESTYLDLNISNKKNFSDSELIILAKAYERIDKYIISENGKWVLTLKSAKELQMSDRLFRFVEEAVYTANRQKTILKSLQENGIKIEKTTDFKQKNIPRLRSGGEDEPPRLKNGGEHDIFYGFGYTIETIYLPHDETIGALHELQAASSAAGFYGGLIAFGFGNGVAGALISIYSYLQGNEFADFEQEYLDSESTSGITLTKTIFYLVDGGLPYTYYNSYIN